MERNAYPSDVTNDAPRRQPAFAAPYLTLMREDAPQRDYELREVFNGTQWVPGWLVHAGAAWRMMPNDLPPWSAIYQQTQRWIAAGVFDAMVQDLRALLRLAAGRSEQPSAVIFDGRTLQSTPESGERAGFDGHKRKKGSKIHMAVDTLGHLLALHVTPANEQERAHRAPEVAELAQQVQEVTNDVVDVAFVDQGYTGPEAAQDAVKHGIELIVVKLPEAKKGFVLLPKRWGR